MEKKIEVKLQQPEMEKSQIKEISNQMAKQMEVTLQQSEMEKSEIKEAEHKKTRVLKRH